MSNRSAFEEMKGICVEISRAEFEFYKQFTITLEGNIHRFFIYNIHKGVGVN